MNPQEQNNQYAQANDPNNPQQPPLPQQDIPPQQPMSTPPEVIGQPAAPQTIQPTQPQPPIVQPQQPVYGPQQPPLQPTYGPQPQQPQAPLQANPYDSLPKDSRFKNLFKPTKKLSVIAGGAISGFIIAGLIVNFVLPRFQTIDLETFSNDSVSILAPKDYDKEEESGGFTFKEKGDEDTQSTVSITAEKLDEQFLGSDFSKEYLKGLESSITEESLSTELDRNNTFKDFKKEKTQFKGGEALLVTANVMDGSKKVGKMKIYFGITKGYLYYTGVAVHADDYALEKNVDKIFDSIEFK